MKIIGSDNHARETVADSLVAENITNEEMGKVMVDALNEKYNSRLGDGPGTWYMLVKDEYRLSKGLEDFI
jgi:20S proteasome alpha/beta subunit